MHVINKNNIIEMQISKWQLLRSKICHTNRYPAQWPFEVADTVLKVLSSAQSLRSMGRLIADTALKDLSDTQITCSVACQDDSYCAQHTNDLVRNLTVE